MSSCLNRLGVLGFSLSGAILLASGGVLELPGFADDFKGEPVKTQFMVGANAGAAVVGANWGFGFLANASTQIIKEGFIPDVTDSVSTELGVGSAWIPANASATGSSNGTFLTFSAHLRWDFVKDERWVLFALGGVGGHSSCATCRVDFGLYPRFGAGVFYRASNLVWVRGDVSHEATMVGVEFLLPSQ